VIARTANFPILGVRKAVPFASMTKLDQLSPGDIFRLLEIDRLTLRPNGISMTEQELVALASQIRNDTGLYLNLVGLEEPSHRRHWCRFPDLNRRFG